MSIVGVLHPGSMGAALGGQLVMAGHEVLWVPAGRSQATERRAGSAGLRSASFEELLRRAEIVVSVCPPAAAKDVARPAHGYEGIWVEANAISPDRAVAVAALVPSADLVDGSVIGSPPRAGKETRLYLSGPSGPAATVARAFEGTLVDARVLGDSVGLASALKMSYTAYQKTSRVLAAVAYALAAEHGVEAELADVARLRAGSYLAEAGYIPKTAARAWRWGPELSEAADALEAAGLPGGLARAAADVLASWPRPADGSDDAGGIAEVLAMLRRPGG